MDAPEESTPVDSTNSLTAPTLLAYYRERVQTFEAEREEYSKRLEAIEVSHAELHRTKWDLRVRQEEIVELQNALSDANVHLFKEREQALRLLAENDQLKIQELEDRKKIQHLLALTKPVAQEVTFFRDCRPNKVTKFSAAGAGSSGKAATSGSESKKGSSVRGSKGEAGKGSRVLRTIYLPNERTESLLKQIESLQAQLEGQEKLSKATIGALEKDRAEREATKRREAESFKQTVEALEKEKNEVAQMLRNTTKDYLEMRKQCEVQRRNHLEEMETLVKLNQTLQEAVKRLEGRVAAEATAVRESLQKENKVFNEQAKRRTSEREKQYVFLQNKHALLSEKAEKQQQSLERKVETLKNKCKNLENRRKMDFEGFARDIAQLRQQTLRCQVQVFGRGVKAMARPEDPTGSTAERQSVLKSQVMELRAKLTELENEMQPAKDSRAKSKGRVKMKVKK